MNRSLNDLKPDPNFPRQPSIRGGHSSCTIQRYLDTNNEQHFFIKKSLFSDNQEVFQNEIKALYQIDFPLICKLCDYSPKEYNIQQTEKPSLLLDYIPGRSLSEYINSFKGEIPIALIYKISWAISYSLYKISQKHLVHRDIKPDNIIIDSNLYPHIVDLGEAVYLVKDSHSTYRPHGTVFFLPPECEEENEEHIVKSKYDVFALGGTIFNLITKKYPFQDLHEYCRNLKDTFIFPDNMKEYQHKFENDRDCFNQNTFGNHLFEYITKKKACDMSYSPHSKSSKYSKLTPALQELMDLVYKCFEPLPDARPSASEVVEEIEKLSASYLNIEEKDDFDAYIETIREEALDKIYGTPQYIKFAIKNKLISDEYEKLLN